MALDEFDRFGEKIIEGFQLSDDDLRALLSLESKEDLEKLYYAARKVRNHYFGNRVFLNRFIYFSTYCKNQCAFCYLGVTQLGIIISFLTTSSLSELI